MQRGHFGKSYVIVKQHDVQKTRNCSMLFRFQVGGSGGGASPLGPPQRPLTQNERSLTPRVREDDFGWEIISSEFGLI